MSVVSVHLSKITPQYIFCNRSTAGLDLHDPLAQCPFPISHFISIINRISIQFIYCL